MPMGKLTFKEKSDGMNINQLQYFVVVAQLQSINKAADNLFVTHQCVSVAIKNLEKEMGAQLFERTSQGVFLNKSGELVYKMANEILEQIRNTKAQLSTKEKEAKNSLKILASIGLNIINLLKMSKQFKKNNTNTMLSIQDRPSVEALKMLIQGEADLIYIGLPHDFDMQSVSEEVVLLNSYRESLNLLVSLNHPLASYKTISFQSVVQYPIVLYQTTSDSDESAMMKRIKKINSEPNIAMITDNIDLHNEAISDGIGIGFISNAIVRSKVLKNKITDLGLTTLQIKGGFSPQIYCITTKQVLRDKEMLIHEFEKEFKKNMWLKSQK